MTRIAPAGVAVVAALLMISTPSLPAPGGETAEVVVLLSAPPLARAPGTGERIDGQQRAFREELETQLPAARVGWRYRLVANGFSLTLPDDDVARLGRLDGVRDVLPAGSYAPQAESTPQQIGAPAIWGQTLDTAGQGVKIGIIDSGIDPDHPYFDPAGYTMPPGFPKGQQRFTTAKVIVARSFAPKTGATAPSVRLAFSEDDSSHGTHVAGIAAGNADTAADGRRISGVAPRAYLGNYKVFVETDDGLSPNANSPAIVAAIEAAVADGMDVINFSGGEPEIEPSRDIVALALDAAADAGVVPVIAAGNDYNDFGAGSVSSPANSEGAIAVGAVDITGTKREHADFSSVGPTTISLRLQADVAAPGVNVPVVGLRRGLGRALGDEHGVSTRRRGSGSPPPAPPCMDGGATEVGTRAVGCRFGDGARPRRRPAIPGWRRGRAPTCRSSAPLRQADGGLVRPHGPRTGRNADRGPRGHRRGGRDVDVPPRRLRRLGQ